MTVPTGTHCSPRLAFKLAIFFADFWPITAFIIKDIPTNHNHGLELSDRDDTLVLNFF